MLEFEELSGQADARLCACCGEELDQNGDCVVNSCTEDDLYGFAEGAQMWDEEDELRMSLAEGRCRDCGAIILEGQDRCPKGYHDDLLDD